MLLNQILTFIVYLKEITFVQNLLKLFVVRVTNISVFILSNISSFISQNKTTVGVKLLRTRINFDEPLHNYTYRTVM